MEYPSEPLTAAERARIAPHVTHLEGPVFGLVNLPETVKGALFARYSRYPGTLRRLFLDEFADSLPEPGDWDSGEGERAAQLYERIFVGYGDDSVAQLGGAHVACEWTSNVLTKLLQRPRLGAYLEQSTRYIAYDAPLPGGGYRYYRAPELGPEYERAMDGLFDAYARALPVVRAWVAETFPRAPGESDAARARAVGAKALDLLRGLLPAASLSHMGIYATGQAYEQLILHLLGHPLPEARAYGSMLLDAIKAMMPSFVARVERPERGGEWIAYLERRRAAAERWAGRLGLDRDPAAEDRPSVRLLHVDGDEDRLLAALLFEAYARALPVVRAWVGETFPRAPGESDAARARAVGAKALDLLRGLLPAASLSHMGIYATGQAYEQLILHLLGHPLPEARAYGSMLLDAIKAMMPSFVARVERPERGGEWIAYLERRRAAAERWAGRLGLDRDPAAEDRPSVRLLHVDGDEDRLLAALLFEAVATGEDATLAAVRALDTDQRARLLGDLVGERANRRHRPGRGFEALRYRFEVVSDYGAFRDLQRHRMLTVQWQGLTPDLGAAVPAEVTEAGAGEAYARALDASATEYHRLADAGLAQAAPYALCLGYRIRYVLDLNAREAMHLIELRSGREGHPAYRAVAHEMHAQIAEHHPAVAAAMSHVDAETEPRLERILSEIRTEARLAGSSK